MPRPKAEHPTPAMIASRTYHQRQLDRGLVKLSVYVPDSDRDAFYQAIDRLRLRWRKLGYEV